MRVVHQVKLQSNTFLCFIFMNLGDKILSASATFMKSSWGRVSNPWSYQRLWNRFSSYPSKSKVMFRPHNNNGDEPKFQVILLRENEADLYDDSLRHQSYRHPEMRLALYHLLAAPQFNSRIQSRGVQYQEDKNQGIWDIVNIRKESLNMNEKVHLLAHVRSCFSFYHKPLNLSCFPSFPDNEEGPYFLGFPLEEGAPL